MAGRRAWHSSSWQHACTWQHTGLPLSLSYGGGSRPGEVGSALHWPCPHPCFLHPKEPGACAGTVSSSIQLQVQCSTKSASGRHCTRLQSRWRTEGTAPERSHEVPTAASKELMSAASLAAALRAVAASSSYQPCSRLRRLAVKIPGCEPGDLPHLVEGRDWRSSLCDALAVQGIQLYRLSVRAGCIHLVLDTVHPDGENAGPGGNTDAAGSSSTGGAQVQQAQTSVQLHPGTQQSSPAQASASQPRTARMSGGLAVQVMATAAATGVQERAAALEAFSPEQLLQLLDPGLVAGRQVLLQADWLQDGALQQSTMQQQAHRLQQQQQEQSAWLLTCGHGTAGTSVATDVTAPVVNDGLQLQQVQQADGRFVLMPGVAGAVGSMRHTMLTLPSGAQLPVFVQPVKVPQQACVDVQAILPAVLPAFHKGILLLHVLARVPQVQPAIAIESGIKPAATATSCSMPPQHAAAVDASSSHDSNTLAVSQLECFVRGDGGYLPATCSFGTAKDIQHLLPENIWPQVCQQLQHGDWQVVRVQLQLQQPLPPGLLHLELSQKGAGPLLGRPGLILVAPSQNVASELSHLGADVAAAACACSRKKGDAQFHLGADSLVCEANVLLRDLGLLLGSLHRVTQPSLSALPAASAHASSTHAVMAVQHQVMGARPAPAWASCVAVRLLIAAVARAWPACTAMLGDGLRALGTNWQAVEAAALQQEQVSMLHLVVRSGCPATAAAALAAGCAVGHAWRLTALSAEQHHLTALHLAAVLPDQQVAAAMVELLLHGVQGAPHAWRHALCGGEPGSSPADMALAVGNMEALAVAALALGDAAAQPPSQNQHLVQQDPDSPPESSSSHCDVGRTASSTDSHKQHSRLQIQIANPAGAAPVDGPPSRHGTGSEASGLQEEDELSPLQLYQQQQAARQQQQLRTASMVLPNSAGASAISSSTASWVTASSTSLASTAAARVSWTAGSGSRSADVGVASKLPPSPPVFSTITGSDAAAGLVSPTESSVHAHAQLPGGGTMADAIRRLSSDKQPAPSSSAVRFSSIMDSQQFSGSRQLGLAVTDGAAHAVPQLLESMPALHYLSEQQAPHRQQTTPLSPTEVHVRPAPPMQAQWLPTELASPTERVPTVIVLPPTLSEHSSQASSMRTAPAATTSASSNAHAALETSAAMAGGASGSHAPGAAEVVAARHTSPKGAGPSGFAAELQMQTAALMPLHSTTPAAQLHKQEAAYEGEWDLVERRATPVVRDLHIETADMNVLDLGKEHSAALHALYEGEWDLVERPSSQRFSGGGVRANGTATGCNSPERLSASPPRRSSTGPMRVGVQHDDGMHACTEGHLHHSSAHRSSRLSHAGAAVLPLARSRHQAQDTELAAASSSHAERAAGESSAEQQFGLRQRLGHSSVAGRVASTSSSHVASASSRGATAAAHPPAVLHPDIAPVQGPLARLQLMLVDAGLMFEDPQLEARYASSRAYAQAGGVDRMAAVLIMLLVFSMLFTMLAQGAWVESCIHFLVTCLWWGPHLAVAVAHYCVSSSAAALHASSSPPQPQLAAPSSVHGHMQPSATAHWATWVLCHRDVWISLMPGPRLLLMVLVMLGWATYPVEWLLVTSSGMDLVTNAMFKPITSQARSQYALLKCMLMLIPDIHMAWVAHRVYGTGAAAAMPWMQWLGAMGRPLSKHVMAAAVQVAFDLRARRLFTLGLSGTQQQH